VSRLLERLQRELELTRQPVERAELLARIGCSHARLGNFDEAKRLVAELRRHFGEGQSGRVTIWIMLTEGLIHWFERLSNNALDRVARAQLLSFAMKYPLGIAMSSAWKAHLEFEQSNFEASFRSIDIAIKHVDTDDHDVLARLAMILCKAFATSGDPEQTKHWFHRGRHFALLDGDRASIEALQYNRAVFTLAWARSEDCLGRLDRAAVATLRSELDSARNLQQLAAADALSNHLRLSHARLLMLEGKFDESIECLDRARSDFPFAEYHFSEPYIDLEIAFCHFNSQRPDEALTLTAGVSPQAFVSLDPDDQLFAAFARFQMAASDPRFGDVEQLRTELTQASAAYTTWLERIRRGLSEVSLALPESS
jgi:tetratricopeptide (TPR) repeat protein